MLGFKEYRNRLTEATPDVETGVQPEDVLKHERAANIQKQVNQIVDAWVSDLKRTLMNPMTPLAQRRGVWDRFKNTMSNMWHGRYNQTNPYFWQNKLGDDLGATQESFNPNSLSLADYKSLRDICESLEEQLNEDVPAGAENLRLVRMIDTKAQELKQKLMSIVGGAEDSSPMSAAASMGTPEEPKVPAASMGTPEEPAAAVAPQEEEEQDSKVPGGFMSLVTVIEGWAKSKKMDIKSAQDLIDRLKSKKDSIRQKAVDDFQVLNTQFNGDEKAPVSGPSASPDAAPASDKGALFTPPSSGKRWDELNPDEKAKWDIYGGGASHSSGTKVDGCLNDHGISKMPWVMRIGDPRRNILAAQKEGKFPDSKKCGNKKVGSHWFDLLHRLGRWEQDDDPIKNAMDFQSRVEKAKATTEEARRKMPRSTAPSDVDAARDAAMGGDEAEVPKTTPMPDPATAPTTPEPAKPSLRDRVGSIGDEVPEVKKFTGDGSGLSEPMHKGDTPTDAPPTDAPPDPKTRVAGMDGAEAIPNPTPEEKPVRQKGRKGRIKTLSDEKTKLKDRIKELSDDDTKIQLLRTLDTIKDRADLGELENELKNHELANNWAGFEIEWNATDVKNFYKQRLHERKGVPQPLVEQKKIEMLSFTERTQYFKEQLQKR